MSESGCSRFSVSAFHPCATVGTVGPYSAARGESCLPVRVASVSSTVWPVVCLMANCCTCLHLYFVSSRGKDTQKQREPRQRTGCSLHTEANFSNRGFRGREREKTEHRKAFVSAFFLFSFSLRPAKEEKTKKRIGLNGAREEQQEEPHSPPIHSHCPRALH